MGRLFRMLLAVALLVTGMLLAGGGQVPTCRAACLSAVVHHPAPASCQISSGCGTAVVTLAGLVAVAAAAPVRLRPPYPVVRVRRPGGPRMPRHLLVTGLDRPPQR